MIILKNKLNIYWLLIFGLIFIIYSPFLLQNGMFIDGIIYAGISKNLANNIGSFWDLKYSLTNFNIFREHPPLVFLMQSFFFKIFGDSFYTERIYIFFNLLISILLINKIWNLIFSKNDSFKFFSFIPILLWITNDQIIWIYANNMLECTLISLILLTFYLFIKSEYISNKYIKYFFIILGSFFIYAAFLSKGPFGLFTLSFFPVYWLIFGKKANFNIYLLNSLIVIFIFLFLLYINFRGEKSSLFLKEYLIFQIINSLDGTNGAQSSNFYILYLLFQKILPLFIILIIVLLSCICLKNKFFTNNFNKNWSIFFLLIGFLSSFPLIITKKQWGHYTSPSLIFFTLSLTIVLIEQINKFLIFKTIINNKIFKFSLILFFIFSIGFAYSRIGKIDPYRNNLNQIEDSKILGEYLKKNEIIGACQPNNLGNLDHYLYRFYNINVDLKNKKSNYLLNIKDSIFCNDENVYKKIDIPLLKFDLYMINLQK